MNRSVIGWVVAAAGLAAAVLVVQWVSEYQRPRPEPKAPPPRLVNCTMATVERGDLPLDAVLTGRVRTVRRARLGFDVAGTLATIDVREGDRVDARAQLATLDPREKQAVLAVAEAAHTRATKELALLEAGTRTEELERLRAGAQAAEADVGWTRGEVERMTPLLEGSVVTRSAYESMVAQRNAAQARFEAAKAALRLAEAGTRAEELEVQRARVAEATAAVARAQTDVDRTRLVAPFAGQVVRRLLAPGDPVTPGLVVLELLDVGAVEVDLDVPAREAARLLPSAQAVLTVDERHGFELRLPVTSVIGESDALTGSRRALVRVGPEQDPQRVLEPGTFVRAKVELAPHREVLLVPADALKRTVDGWLLVKAGPPKPADPAAAPPPPGAPQMPPLPVAVFVPVRLIEQSRGRAAVEPLGVPLGAGDRVVVVGADMAWPDAMLLERRDAPPAGAPGAAAPAKDAK
jgi:HlyD family secretion protein